MDDTTDEHLDSLLKTIIDLEQKNGKKLDTDFITWRGMMTKVFILFMAKARAKGRIVHGSNI